MMSVVNYVIYGCSSVRKTPEVSLYRSFLTLEKNIIAVITQNRERDGNLERQIKNQILCTCRLFLLLFNILAISQMYFSFYSPSLLAASQSIFFFMVNNFSVDQAGSYINRANNYLFIIPFIYLYTSKKPPFLKFAIFSDVILVPNYRGCKGNAINLIPHYLIEIIHKTVKPSHLVKL